jgi:hypothetical protein
MLQIKTDSIQHSSCYMLHPTETLEIPEKLCVLCTEPSAYMKKRSHQGNIRFTTARKVRAWRSWAASSSPARRRPAHAVSSGHGSDESQHTWFHSHEPSGYAHVYVVPACVRSTPLAPVLSTKHVHLYTPPSWRSTAAAETAAAVTRTERMVAVKRMVDVVEARRGVRRGEGKVEVSSEDGGPVRLAYIPTCRRDMSEERRTAARPGGQAGMQKTMEKDPRSQHKMGNGPQMPHTHAWRRRGA